MTLEPLVLLGATEVTGIAALSGIVVTGSFALVYKTLDIAAKERAEERRVREKEAEGNRAAIQALDRAVDVLERTR